MPVDSFPVIEFRALDDFGVNAQIWDGDAEFLFPAILDDEGYGWIVSVGRCKVCVDLYPAGHIGEHR